ncbi:hypothetical protein TNCV_911301 [Trichonephila clavipes]|nr:hypothetical protein TNCV_911301 [Trichonephila clavipes]
MKPYNPKPLRMSEYQRRTVQLHEGICRWTTYFAAHPVLSLSRINTRQSASGVERLANQRLLFARDKVFDWPDAQRSSLTA